MTTAIGPFGTKCQKYYGTRFAIFLIRERRNQGDRMSVSKITKFIFSVTLMMASIQVFAAPKK
jgi:hypothetical protein